MRVFEGRESLALNADETSRHGFAPIVRQPKAPRVSVIIPYYKSLWSIERTLRSVMAQRFRDFEVLIIDDGSPDDLEQGIVPYRDAVRVVRQENRGLAGARNRGIAESRGEFVAPLDADDLWHPDFLGEMVGALDSNPSAPFAFGDTLRIDEEDRLLPDRILNAEPRIDFAGLLSLNTVRSGSGAVFRRAAMQAAGGYDESLRERAAQGAEDWKLLVQLSARASPVHVPRLLVAYRLVAGSMSQARPAHQLRAIEAVLGDLRAGFPDAPDQLFRDARTMMIAWLLPAFLRKCDYLQALKQGARAYLMNPLWWRNSNLRLAHLAWVRSMLRPGAVQPGLFSPLADYEEDGARPFAFLNTTRGAADASAPA